MKKRLNKNLIERFSRQIILKNVGILGQKKILSAKVLVVGAGGLGCSALEYLVKLLLLPNSFYLLVPKSFERLCPYY